MKNDIKKAFMLGVVVGLIVNLMHQDFLGKELYLQMVEMFWVDVHWAWWVIPFTIVIVLLRKIEKVYE